jgi:nucleoside-diphosphate-sugar epimerase
VIQADGVSRETSGSDPPTFDARRRRLRKALITGGAGFIGLHLTRHIVARGGQVDLVDDFSRGTRDRELTQLLEVGGTRLLECDLTRPGALADVASDYHCVVHLAAMVGVARVADHPYDVLTSNVAMIANALDAARRQERLHRFVYVSTSEVYAGTLRYFTLPLPTPESTPVAVAELSQPRTSYMLSKIYGEALCHHAQVPFTIVRPHNVYGPRMGFVHVIPEVLKRAYDASDGGSLEVYSSGHTRTFCYIEDAVELMWRAAASPCCVGETLNIGTQAPEITMGELAALIARVVGKELKIVPLSATAGSPARRCPDISKAVTLTEYEPRVSLEEGIRRTYEWYRANVFEARRSD